MTGAIYFYWQAGVVTYLRENGYDLGKVTVSGASAGALTAAMTATNVDFYKATQYALGLADSLGLWDRPSGLLGVWGPMVLEWLEAMLPENATQLAHEHDLTLVVTQMPRFQKDRVQSFQSRQDLIACLQASIHIPWFMDGNATIPFRNKHCIDGFIPPLVGPLHRQPLTGESSPASTIVIDWRQDPKYRFVTPLHTVLMLSPKGIWGLLEQGKVYAKHMEEKGLFETIPKLNSINVALHPKHAEVPTSEPSLSVPTGVCR